MAQGLLNNSQGDAVRCDRTPVWATLQAYFSAQAPHFDLRQAFANDPQRFALFSQQAPHVFADLSKNLVDAPAQALLLSLARQCGLEQQRDAMFAGALVNRTEQRPALHFLLRYPPLAHGAPHLPQLPKALEQDLQQVHATLQRMYAYADQIRRHDNITDIVNIGIGGSDLGPQTAVLALSEFVNTRQRFHFASNADPRELAEILAKLKPQQTLFLVASKTFTTAETVANARAAMDWFVAQGGQRPQEHFVALTAHAQAAHALGINTVFPLWDWVGGRYSVWSAIGLVLTIAVGGENFSQFLAGAHAMDTHFRAAPLEQNLPARLGLLDVWYRNFYGFTSRSLAPYSSALRRFPAYLQQLEMESNGKRVDQDGQALPFASAPVLWGEPGTNGQHAYFQMLHQGSDVVPVEFVAVKPSAALPLAPQQALLANALAQAQALMVGRVDADGHHHFPGNRPSTFLLLEQLNPTTLGALMALQEHRVFVSGALWGINSFDQWGVELGKKLAQDIRQRLQTGDVAGLDGSTAGLLKKLV